jgi:F0F1-type ATP synthase epsilon subunit
MANIIKVKISNPEKVFFEGEASSVSSKNDSGPFDILANHANFISLLHDATVTVRSEAGQPQDYIVHRGLLSSKDNFVRIFVDL